MPSLELSPPVFSILSQLIEERVGIHYSVADRDLLREKASARAIEVGFSSLLDYYYFLRYDQASERELSDLVETLVVNETYFFREWDAITMLVEKFIAPRCLEGRRVRIWSAACASGEEPLSLAMLLDHKGLLDQVEIVASDISPRILERAQSGNYGKRAIRTDHPPHFSRKYIEKRGEAYVVSPQLVSKINWRQQNLLELKSSSEKFDFIICRNVLIYFSDATVKTVLESLAARLNSDGMLLVGVSESLFRFGSGFVGEEHDGSFIYRGMSRT